MNPTETALPAGKASLSTTPTNILRIDEVSSLAAFFKPKSVAVIGASEAPGSVGRSILWNMLSHPFGGTVYPVNMKRSSVMGVKAYRKVADIPEQVDLAVVVTPAATVPGVIQECADARIPAAVIISAGFKEHGAEGARLEKQVVEIARQGRVRIIGPNCIGIMNPVTGLNATFTNEMALKGNVAFISQSGALCTAVLDWSLREKVGFSAFVSIGSMADVSWGDLIDYLGNDPNTKSIIIYMETIGNARAFMSAAREVALNKPIIVLKAGRTKMAAQAAASHTGSLTGSHEVLDAAFRRAGVLSVNRIDELFYMAEVLSKQPRPRGPRLSILTNAGGPGVLATDAIIAVGGQLAALPEDLEKELSTFLPDHWSHANPIDILGDANPERYAKALEVVARNPESDGILVIVTPQGMTDPTGIAHTLAVTAKKIGKPVLASWMGGAEMTSGVTQLNEAGVPTFAYPDTAARVFNYMWRYTANLRNLYETPIIAEDDAPQNRELVNNIIEQARKVGRTVLTETESKEILHAYGITTVRNLVAMDEDQALAEAEEIGYPVVLKLHSNTITHKSDIGGVRLNLCDADAVRKAFQNIRTAVSEKIGAEHFQGVSVQPMIKNDGYELILGSTIDPQFGPVILFGSGGQLVEVYQDRALGLPPLNTTLALRMMEKTKIYNALKGVRGRQPVNLIELEQLVVKFSELVVEQRLIKEIDINPILAGPDRIIALDARILIHDPEVNVDNLPPLAIRRYPTNYEKPWITKHGTEVIIRPIRPEDEPLMVHFHETLSERSVYQRWLHMINLSQRTAHERLTRICFIDYDREMALVADHKDPETGQHEVMAVGRLTKLYGTREAEFAVLVSDKFQGHGLGKEILGRLIDIGRDEKLQRIVGWILPENRDMQRVCEKLGFRHKYSFEDQLVKAELEL